MSRAARERPRVVLAAALCVLFLLAAGALGATLSASEPKTPPAAQARMQRLAATVDGQQQFIVAARDIAERTQAELDRAQARAERLRQANRTLRRRVVRLRGSQRRQPRPARERPSRSAPASVPLTAAPPAAPTAASGPAARPKQTSPAVASGASGGEFEP